ncbi:MAG: DUF3352 domain-containing protein [Planctomycetota bacterium]
MKPVITLQPLGQARSWLLAATCAFTPFFAAPAFAQEKQESTLPGAPRLLPQDTMAYIRLDNADDLRDDLEDSSVGRMLNDPKLKPFADELYSTARDLFDEISDQVGVTLDELLSIPHGQVAIAVHPAKPLAEDDKGKEEVNEDETDEERQRRRTDLWRREQFSFGGTLIVDAGKNIDRLMAIVDKLEGALLNNGRRRRVKEVDGTDVVRLLPSRAGRLPVEYFEKDGTLVIGFGHSVAQDVLAHWMGESEESTLADDADFGTIISRCVGAEDTRPQITFYVDPHAIVDRIIKRSGNLTAGFVWPLVENLGVSRIGGVGGSSFRGGEVFEDISHLHIKVDPPRDGVLGLLRPETGDTSPPKWVPESVSGYTSLHWDLEQTYENLGKVIDQFQGADSLKRFVEQPTETRTGIKLREDVLSNMTGRILRVSWMQKPVRINSNVTVVAFEVSDSVKLKSVLARYRDRDPGAMQVDSVSGNVVYRFRGPGDRFPEGLRRPEPSIMVLGKWLIYADSTQFLEKAALAQAGSFPRLIDVPDYDLVASELGGKLDGEQPFFLSFIRGSDAMRLVYDLAKEDSSKQALRGWGESNPVAQRMADLLEGSDLPPFSEFEKYFAPSGMFGYDEPDGMHFGFYTLRADEALQGE